jgi:S-adenosylmethionine:tRNA ribosyltransferase-isomerase
VDVTAFDFELPDELIAQEPPTERGASRLLVLDREDGRRTHARFSEIGRYLRAGDLLVLNDTRVFPARLLGHRVPSGGAVECLLVERVKRGSAGPFPETRDEQPTDAMSPTRRGGSSDPPGGDLQTWTALMHPGQKLKPGARVLFERDDLRLHGEVLARHFQGRRTIALWTDEGTCVAEAIDRIGHMPLPPYIKRADRPSDWERYQTVYARERGSIAAPTAGLHFTQELLDELTQRGVERTAVTLHVGYGTFKPVRVERVEAHVVDPEHFTVSETAAEAITRAKREGRRVVAVGTTTARALESLSIDDDGVVRPATGETNLFIHPGHSFRVVDGLVTNFHLPKSSLLMLVSALAGREHVLAAYREAVERRYRFYSYGDAMLVL